MFRLEKVALEMRMRRIFAFLYLTNNIGSDLDGVCSIFRRSENFDLKLCEILYLQNFYSLYEIS